MNFKPTNTKLISSILGGTILAIFIVLLVKLSGMFPRPPLCGVDECSELAIIPVPIYFWVLVILILTVIFSGLIYLIWSLVTKKNK